MQVKPELTDEKGTGNLKTEHGPRKQTTAKAKIRSKIVKGILQEGNRKT